MDTGLRHIVIHKYSCKNGYYLSSSAQAEDPVKLGRKGDGYPGVKTMWIGFQRMVDRAHAWAYK
jgi:hypothetical protein